MNTQGYLQAINKLRAGWTIISDSVGTATPYVRLVPPGQDYPCEGMMTLRRNAFARLVAQEFVVVTSESWGGKQVKYRANDHEVTA